MAPQSTNEVIDYLTFTVETAAKRLAWTDLDLFLDNNGENYPATNVINAPNLCNEPRLHKGHSCLYEIHILDKLLLTVCIWVVDKADAEFPRMHQCFQSVYIL